MVLVVQNIWLALRRRYRRVMGFGHKPFSITLEDLAQNLWLKHNHAMKTARQSIAVQKPKVQEPNVSPPVVSTPASSQLELLPTTAEVELSPPPFSKSESVQPVSMGSFFVVDFVTPYEAILQQQGVRDVIMRIIEMLEEHGACPSIVLEGVEHDEEARELAVIRKTLGKITLKDHTHRVTTLAIEGLKSTYRDWEPLLPKLLVVALGHDLGKIPAFRQASQYTLADHPSISAMKLRELVAKEDEPFWWEEALGIVKGHHRKTTQPFAAVLRQADTKARELEVVRGANNLTLKPWDSWFQVPAVLDQLKDRINVVQRNRACDAFTLKSVVYCQPDAVFRAVQTCAKAAQVIDLSLIRSGDREMVLRQVVEAFRQAEILADDIGEGFYGRQYRVVTSQAKRQGNVRQYFIPINLEAFGEQASVFEQRKEGWVQLITAVERGG